MANPDPPHGGYIKILYAINRPNIYKKNNDSINKINSGTYTKLLSREKIFCICGRGVRIAYAEKMSVFN